MAENSPRIPDAPPSDAGKSDTGKPHTRLFLFGRGFVAGRLVSRLLSCQDQDPTAAAPEVIGATHRVGGEARVTGDVPFGPDAPLPGIMDKATHLLLSIPPDATGDPVLNWFGVDRLRRMKQLRWIGYLSSTGVYGDHGGAWIDETASLYPPAGAPTRRAEAEAAWLAQREKGLPVTVFRLSGIYGPGRSAFNALKNGTARRIDKPGQVFCRCHVDDIATVLLASMQGAGHSAIYNVADDLPAPQEEIVRHAAELMGVAPPPLVPYDPESLSEAGRRFYEACRRIGNDRIKDELGVNLAHPTYREGLRAIAEQEGRLASGG